MLLGTFQVFGEGCFTVSLFFWLFAFFGAVFIVFVVSLSWLIASAAVFGGLIVLRHFQVKGIRYLSASNWLSRPDPNAPGPDLSKVPAVYFLYVMGSGGHSAEMIETVKQKFRGYKNQHRRYVVTSGDKSSQDMILRLEAQIADAYPNGGAGTFDVFAVKRARAVHQSLLTSPYTCLIAAMHAANALTRAPNERPARRFGTEFKYPHVIVTNGPATGFIIGLVAHVLKVFFFAPQNRLKTVYIESWARTETLSLTGKLFLWTGIANVFGVQHQDLARAIPGAEYVGQVTGRLTPVG
ncbi:hypothetical protein OQA88_5036 [Cercophora sp. LCS_1]